MIDYKPGFLSEISTNRIGTDKTGLNLYELTKPLLYTSNDGEDYLVPIGYRTNFYSIPRRLRWLIDPEGPGKRAAALHDWAYSREANIPREKADRLFYEAMIHCGVDRWRAFIRWSAVRLFSASKFRTE